MRLVTLTILIHRIPIFNLSKYFISFQAYKINFISKGPMGSSFCLLSHRKSVSFFDQNVDISRYLNMICHLCCMEKYYTEYSPLIASI